ncbi:non-heme iron oxygenase ferredoxin subunit [Aquihabitans sp. G128]|uniref:non-heme iron oxygenase ferredoxin subunit n=1 Tax=Aquihabitans sp. G128 TaxID=2849779 RepID=UPI001C22D033|nr:non-heme iron oxygenase ferredoxin subunit [Aquihabitans sp. G128]QXC61227.1 non-heme iron oxygenase ferredoxin subunit [Aquihabitans sp. G128]
MSTVTVAQLADLPDGGATRFDVEGRRLSVVRIDDAVYVIGDTCTHADISLSEGEVDVDTCHIECWKHGSSFSLVTGEPDSFPATRPVPVYEVAVVDGAVVVTLPEPEEAAAR